MWYVVKFHNRIIMTEDSLFPAYVILLEVIE